MYQIGEVAERVGLSLRTVRYYEEVGLLSPAARTQGHFRLFSEHDVERLLIIMQMKPSGFTLEEMREQLEIRERLKLRGPAAEHAALVSRLAAYASGGNREGREAVASISPTPTARAGACTRSSRPERARLQPEPVTCRLSSAEGGLCLALSAYVSVR